MQKPRNFIEWNDCTLGMGVSFSVRTHPNGLAELGNFPQLIAT